MATQDRSRQQSSFSPQSGTQQGGGAASREEQGGAQHQQRDEGRSLTSRQGTWLGARDRDYYSLSPFGLMQRLTADMDRLLENFGMGMFSRGAWPFAGLRQSGLSGPTATWSPHIEMFEQEGKLVVQAELPGLRREDVQAQIEDDAVVISGERRNETQTDEGGRYLSERSYGSFYRVIPLPTVPTPRTRARRSATASCASRCRSTSVRAASGSRSAKARQASSSGRRRRGRAALRNNSKANPDARKRAAAPSSAAARVILAGVKASSTSRP